MCARKFERTRVEFVADHERRSRKDRVFPRQAGKIIALEHESNDGARSGDFGGHAGSFNFGSGLLAFLLFLDLSLNYFDTA